MNNIDKNVICPLPWVHLMVQPNGNIQPCCMTSPESPIGNTKDVTLEEVWNGTELKTIRKKMLNGEKPHMCNRCYLLDDSGVISPRQAAMHNYGNDLSSLVVDTNPQTGHNDKFILKYWDFRFSNLCNFKCRMCGTLASSKWTDDELAIYGECMTDGVSNIRSTSKTEIFDYIDKFINDVEEIYFAGGEPLIMDEHYIILEKLIKAGRTDVSIRYNTNFSNIVFKKWDLRKLWKPFIDDKKGNISVHVSLDAVGELAEFARHGTNWKELYSNIETTNNTGINLGVSVTVSLLNVFYLPELFDSIKELKIPPHLIGFNNFLTNPLYFDIRILPDELKNELKEKLIGYSSNLPTDMYTHTITNCIEYCLNFINTDLNVSDYKIQERRLELLRTTTILDIRRNESFLKTNSQYTKWFTEMINYVNLHKNPNEFYKEKVISTYDNSKIDKLYKNLNIDNPINIENKKPKFI